MTSNELKESLAELGARWQVVAPNLTLTLKGPMTKTGQVAAYAGSLADEMDHHPNIALEYAGLTLAIHTHDQNAITALDVAYAKRLEAWLRANGWPA